MMNSEIRISEIRKKAEARRPKWAVMARGKTFSAASKQPESVPPLGFGFHSSFVIRHPSFQA